jgi:hypothetical protein
MDTMGAIATALEALERGETLNQAITKILLKYGYINATEVTHLQSGEREYLATSITAKGLRLQRRKS